MYRSKIFFSIVLLSFLLIITSMVKNETREIEKKILNVNKKISQHEKDLNEISQKIISNVEKKAGAKLRS